MEVNTYNIPGVCIAFRTLINVTNLGLCLIHLHSLTLQYAILLYIIIHIILSYFFLATICKLMSKLKYFSI